MKEKACKKLKVITGIGSKFRIRAITALSEKRGEGYIDTGVKILMAVVLGALLLAGLYTLFGDNILPTLTQKIKDLFNYAS